MAEKFVLDKDTIVANLETVKDEVRAAMEKGNRKENSVRLVAVSKTKPADSVRAAYSAGQRIFGENYVKEMFDKATELQELDGIQWHFIGHLQSNKVKMVCTTPNIVCIETVDSEKLAKLIEKEMEKLEKSIDVFVEINTSGEESKSGVVPEKCNELCVYISENCPHLKLCGLMTIGEPEHGERDFNTLKGCRAKLAEALRKDENELELSMGMSSDFQLAIVNGSTNVRVGSSIFGGRYYPNRQQ